MKKNFHVFTLSMLMTTLLFSACKKEDAPEVNDEEVITTTLLKFTPLAGGTTLEYKYEDLDGPGGAVPVIDDIVLAPATSYSVSLVLLNKTVSPADTISNEVGEESAAHRFYFETSAGSNILVSDLDTDANGVDLGMNSIWTTGSVSTGSIRITLRHYAATPPNKLQSDPVNSGKSTTDLENDFVTQIQ